MTKYADISVKVYAFILCSRPEADTDCGLCVKLKDACLLSDYAAH